MDGYWGLIECDEFGRWKGHDTGRLRFIIYPRFTHSGGATWAQGCELSAIWESYGDDYGVFGAESECSWCPRFPPLNNAPSNWSSVDIDAPYCNDYKPRPWTSERVWEIKTNLIDLNCTVWSQLMTKC